MGSESTMLQNTLVSVNRPSRTTARLSNKALKEMFKDMKKAGHDTLQTDGCGVGHSAAVKK